LLSVVFLELEFLDLMRSGSILSRTADEKVCVGNVEKKKALLCLKFTPLNRSRMK
jgi:hypothetical protein